MLAMNRTWSSGDSEESYTTYDLLGRVSTQSTASGHSMAYVYDEWDRAFLSGIATKLYGARTAASRKSTPWAEGEVIDRGDGETWTVVATTGKSVTVQRSRDGALATLGQLGEARP